MKCFKVLITCLLPFVICSTFSFHVWAFTYVFLSSVWGYCGRFSHCRSGVNLAKGGMKGLKKWLRGVIEKWTLGEKHGE